MQMPEECNTKQSKTTTPATEDALENLSGSLLQAAVVRAEDHGHVPNGLFWGVLSYPDAGRRIQAALTRGSQAAQMIFNRMPGDSARH